VRHRTSAGRGVTRLQAGRADVHADVPFTFADRIKTPVLLIHSGAGDNSDTFPIQSERFYAALRGNGGAVRYVVLSNEPHGYRAMGSTEETLWQMTDWLDRWVKPKRGAASAAGAKP
jgi:dipeptidyl aminopeptidase/acylaminoacyl peptidase